jgi:membrane fusion protein, multidrug efflux system
MTATALDGSTVSIPVIGRPKLDRKKLALAGLAFAVVLGAVWYGHHWWTLGRFIESSDDAYVGGDVTAISPHVAGFVAEIPVTDNQYVQAGQLLIRLDDRDVRAAVDRTQAIVQEREATLAGLHAKYLLQQSAIKQAEADLAAKTARAAFTSVDAVRYRNLAVTNMGTRQDAQRTDAADKEARAAVSSSQAGLGSAKQQLGVLDAEIGEAVAAVAQAKADLQTARLNLSYTEIRSPIDGYIGNRAARVGSYVAEGAYLVTVVPAHGLWIDANFKEDQLERMTLGQPATIVADVVPGHVFRGRILSLAPGTGAIFSVIPPENATGNFTKIVQRVPVRILLDAHDPILERLRPGLSTTVSVDVRAGPEVAP